MILDFFIHIVLGCIVGAVMVVVPLSRFTSSRFRSELSTKKRLVIYLQHVTVLLCAIGIVALVMRVVHDFQPRSYINLIVLVLSAVVTCGLIWRKLFKKGRRQGTRTFMS